MNFAMIMQKLCFVSVAVIVFGQSLPAQQSSLPTSKQTTATETKIDSTAAQNKQAKPAPKTEENKTVSNAKISSGQINSPSVNELSDQQLSEEEAAILPVYRSYLKEYLLGPEDVISVEVFGQPNYSKSNITVPPTAKISYPLISGGIPVGGKTVDQVADEIKKKLDEYIIDPQVMVTLDKVGSARFSVLGRVNAPGVKLMNRRYNLFEAVAEAGGIGERGDKKRVVLMRLSPQGNFTHTIVDFDKLQKGQTAVLYLAPGDQIIVPEKKWSISKIFNIVGQASSFAFLLRGF